ncbi:MAG: GAF domain-containing protein, partial [Chloroflexi bacterium]|nr:GAF domain-containing protein [Chloroflexota bacterium]
MSASEIEAGPEWKQFLRLGESLLNQPSIRAQCEILASTLQQWLNCQAQIWLARPFYPLPGEPEVATLPDAGAPAPAAQAFSTRHLSCQTGQPPLLSPCNESGRPTHVAIPLISQDDLLGVAYIQRPDDQPFKTEDINFLIGAAAIAALALQNTRQVALKNWRYEQLALVRSVSAQISNVLDLDELCRRVTRLIQDTFDYYYVVIFTMDAQQQRLSFRASASQNDVQTPLSILSLPLGEGITGTVALTAEEMLARDVAQEPHYRYVDTLSETRSEFAVPLKIEDHVLGVLDVQSDKLDDFHDIDLMVLRALADNIALAVDGAHLYSDLQRRAEQINAVFEVSRTLTSILDLDKLLKKVVQLIQSRFGYPFVHVYTVHPLRNKVLYRAGSGARSQAMQEYQYGYNLDDPTGMIPWVARNGRTLLANDVTQEPLYRPSNLPPSNTRAELSVPLTFGSQIQGVLDIQSDQVNAFDENDRFLLEALAASIAIAIRNATLYRTERWRRQVADSFRDVAGLVSGNLALDKLLEAILAELEHNLPCEVSALWLLDEANPEEPAHEQTLKLAAVHGIAAEQITRALQESPVARTWLKHALASSLPIIRQPADPYGPLGTAAGFPPEYSSISAPLLSGDRPLGVLTLAHSTPGRYGGEAGALTTTFASYATVAIQNARLFASAQEQAWISTVLLRVAEA